jgi:hypothetical protein
MSHRRMGPSILLVAVAFGLSFVSASVPISSLGVERLPDGNTLIADGGYAGQLQDARVLEVDSLGRLVWAYVKNDVPFVHTARRLANGNTLMSSSVGNKVIEVNRDGDTVWTYSWNLAYPNEASRLANGNTLITVRDFSHVIEVKPDGSIVWMYTNLNGPHNGNRLANGHTLICDGGNDRVVEVDATGSMVWQYATGLSWPRSVQRLSNGNTLIADSRNNRVIEVDSAGSIAWSADDLRMPYAATRLGNGNTLVSIDQGVVELTPDDSIVWQYPNTVPMVVETLQVVNPTSGGTIYAHIHRPAYAGPDNRVPGIVFVPGGIGYGSWLDSTTTPDDIASDGFALMHFDPDGRGRSSLYPENYDGYVQQDGMHACLSALASREYVDTSRLGVYSRGYGITMASGMIARHAEPHVKFLLDFEGSADRSQSCQDSGGVVPVPADSDAFWQEREAARFMKKVPSAYLRVQTLLDRNPRIPGNLHAIQLIDSATDVAYGGAGISPWTRMNDSLMNMPNQVYTMSDPPVWIPETQDAQSFVRILLYLHELADMDLPGAVAERRDLGVVPPLQVMPRPCRGVLQVEMPAVTGTRELQVHDVCGRLVLRATAPSGTARAALDLNNLQPGVYYVSAAGAGAVPVVVVR